MIKKVLDTIKSSIKHLDHILLNKFISLSLNQMKHRDNTKYLKNNCEGIFTIFTQPVSTNFLTELADQYGSDKGSYRTHNHPYPWVPHTYTDYYYWLFNSARRDIKLVFECGIGTNKVGVPSSMRENGVPGASLRMWKDFFPNAQVYGGDIDSEILFSEDRIQTFYLDQLNSHSIQRFWNQVKLEGFNIIIDDGLHTLEAGLCLLDHSFQKLAEHGTYIIEDVNSGDFAHWHQELTRRKLTFDFVILDRGKSTTQDNNLIVIRNVN